MDQTAMKHVQPKDRPFELDLRNTSHRPWPLPDTPPVLHYAEHINVVAWSPEPLDRKPV